MLAEVRKQVAELVATRVVECCTSQPASLYAIVMVKKPNAPVKYCRILLRVYFEGSFFLGNQLRSDWFKDWFQQKQQSSTKPCLQRQLKNFEEHKAGIINEFTACATMSYRCGNAACARTFCG